MIDYPTGEQLKVISDYDPENGLAGIIPLIEDAWNSEYGRIKWDGITLELITGGWSGNEEVIDSLSAMFCMVYWIMSKRGGCHQYREKTC